MRFFLLLIVVFPLNLTGKTWLGEQKYFIKKSKKGASTLCDRKQKCIKFVKTKQSYKMSYESPPVISFSSAVTETEFFKWYASMMKFLERQVDHEGKRIVDRCANPWVFRDSFSAKNVMFAVCEKRFTESSAKEFDRWQAGVKSLLEETR